MIQCTNCGWIGDESELIETHTTYEAYYCALTGGSTPLTLYQCPECGEYDYIEDYYEDDEDEEE